MSYVSVKNQIQEYCQQRKHALPIYVVESLRGGHEPNFKCTLTVFDREFIAEGRSKKIATFTAAEQAIAYMNKEEYYKEPSIPSPNQQIFVLIDVENIPRLAHDIIEMDNIILILVGRREHVVMKTLWDTPKFRNKDNVIFTYAEFNRKDAADIVMCIELGGILEALPPTDITYFVIVSNDHFAQSVKDYINIQTVHNAYVVTDLESFADIIGIINVE